MSLPRIGKAIGTKFPNTPEDLANEYKKVIGPLLLEMRQRFNELEKHIGYLHRDDAAAIAEIDATDMGQFTVVVDDSTGDLYYLDATGTPGIGDIAASPAGAWFYSQTL
jgi:hypothetical protein